MSKHHRICIRLERVDSFKRIPKQNKDQFIINNLKKIKLASFFIKWDEYKISQINCVKDFRDESNVLQSPVHIANMANEYLISRMNPTFAVEESHRIEPIKFEPFKLSEEQVRDAILNIKTPHAYGTLLLSGEMLQITSGGSATCPLILILFHLFKRSIEQGVVPLDWRYTVVTLKHKDGPTDQIESYRPIGTTNVVSKVTN